MVVAIGNDREVPSNVSIYAGEFSRFLIVFNLVDYVSTTSEFSCDNTAVTLSLDPEYQNILSVAVDSAAAVGSVATIKFREQVIMHVTLDEKSQTFTPNLVSFNNKSSVTLELSSSDNVLQDADVSDGSILVNNVEVTAWGTGAPALIDGHYLWYKSYPGRITFYSGDASGINEVPITHQYNITQIEYDGTTYYPQD